MTTAAFFSSFEAGDPQPVSPGLAVDSGPRRSPTAKTGVGCTGVRALRYSAGSPAALFEVDIPVAVHTVLSYAVFPESDGPVPTYRSTHVALDLEFADGTRAGFSPTAQGDAKTLYVDQWNLVRRPLSAFAGKRVRRILLCTGAGGAGWLDDVRLADEPPVEKSLPERVRTTRGTHSSSEFSRGNTFPATAVPHGFNFWTPITDARALNWFYSYHRHNDAQNRPRLQAFGVSHQPSPWMGDRHTFHLMPGTGPVEADRVRRSLPFRHDDELDRPHHYRVRFGNGLTAELAPTEHAAMFRFAFPSDDNWLLFDNARNRGGIRVHPDEGVVTAHTWVRSGLSAGARRMFVYAETDQRPTGGARLRRPFWRTVTGHLEFADAEVTLRIATSLISLAQAKRNLEQEIPRGTAFDQVRDYAEARWEEVLGRVELEGASDDELTTFYSSLYRLFLYPNIAHENTPRGLRHASPVARSLRPSTRRRTGAKLVDGELYVNHGFWDTYRTAWPAYALLAPRQCGRMIDGFVQQYREGGWIARWSSPGYADLMTGTSSDVAFADAYLKGVRNFDVRAAYDAALKNATVAPPRRGVGRKGLDRSPYLGYTPTSVRGGLSWALEGCLNDYGLANLSDTLGCPDNAAYLRQRAQHYRNHFDRRIGFFQGRTPAGAWRSPAEGFDPTVWGPDYVETNAWNTAFSVPHDGPGLAALHGGPAGLEAKLDEFFRIPETGQDRRIHEMTEARDVRMGQYGHSNQPSHHIPFVYAFAGAHAKLQRTVREVLRRLYLGSELGQGYPGDEDNGEMSAWYVFSALGLYPLAVGSPQYTACAPLFRSATVHLDDGKDLVIQAPRAATATDEADTPYVHGLTVDGEPHPSATLAHSVLARGAVLEFDVRAEPGSWGGGPVTPAEPAPLADLAGSVHSPDGPADALVDDTSRGDAVFRTACPTVTFTVAGEPREVVLYTLTSGSRAGDPRDWVLEGSDDGRQWRTLDERSGEVFRWRRQLRPFALAEPAACRQYRLRVGASSGRRVALAQWELLAR